MHGNLSCWSSKPFLLLPCSCCEWCTSCCELGSTLVSLWVEQVGGPQQGVSQGGWRVWGVSTPLNQLSTFIIVLQSDMTRYVQRHTRMRTTQALHSRSLALAVVQWIRTSKPLLSLQFNPEHALLQRTSQSLASSPENGSSRKVEVFQAQFSTTGQGSNTRRQRSPQTHQNMERQTWHPKIPWVPRVWGYGAPTQPVTILTCMQAHIVMFCMLLIIHPEANPSAKLLH